MLRVCDVQNNSFGVAGKNALNEAYRSTPGRVERAMPLSWHVGASVGAGIAGTKEKESGKRLAQAPRSLVSVETAGGDSKLARKSKPTGVCC